MFTDSVMCLKGLFKTFFNVIFGEDIQEDTSEWQSLTWYNILHFHMQAVSI